MTDSEWILETEKDMTWTKKIHSDVESLKPIEGVPLTEADRRTAEAIATDLAVSHGLMYTRISASVEGGIGITYLCDKTIGIGIGKHYQLYVETENEKAYGIYSEDYSEKLAPIPFDTVENHPEIFDNLHQLDY